MEMMNDENALPRSTSYRCGICCARPGEEHAADCTEANIARAAIIAADMLAELDPAKVPLAVPAAIGVLLAAINAGPAASRRAAGGEVVLPSEPTDALLVACGWEEWRPGNYVDRGAATARYNAIRAAAGVTPAPASAGQAAPASAEQDEICEHCARPLGTQHSDSCTYMGKVLPVHCAAQPAEGAGQIARCEDCAATGKYGADPKEEDCETCAGTGRLVIGSAAQAGQVGEYIGKLRSTLDAISKRYDTADEMRAAAQEAYDLTTPTERAAAPADSEVLRALRDGIPLQEPVYIGKALRAGREARVCLSGGTGPVACAMLVNIQLTGWADGPETAEAFVKGYNRALKDYRHALLEIATDRLAAPADLPDDWKAAIAEVERATRKFPTWPTDPLHAVAVLGKEFGELTKAVLQTTYEPHKVQPGELRTEAVQTAAMALRFLASLRHYEFSGCPQHDQGAIDQPSAQDGGEA